jgi:hypothetical protein
MDQLPLSTRQCEILYDAMRSYSDQVNQPTETAADNTQLRKEVKSLLQYIENNTQLGTKTYKMVHGEWVLLKT